MALFAGVLPPGGSVRPRIPNLSFRPRIPNCLQVGREPARILALRLALSAGVFPPGGSALRVFSGWSFWACLEIGDWGFWLREIGDWAPGLEIGDGGLGSVVEG